METHRPFVRSSDDELRVVLFPHGPLHSEELRNKCSKLLIFCGADLGRILDQAFAGNGQNIDRFMRYISHLNRSELLGSIVILTKTNPLAMRIIGDRIRLCSKIPKLETALWCIFIDEETDPFVWDNLMRSGEIIGHPKQAPIFTDYDGADYLLFVPDYEAHESIRTNAHKILRLNRDRFINRELPTARQSIRKL